jgi:hypothetical protein
MAVITTKSSPAKTQRRQVMLNSFASLRENNVFIIAVVGL